jgi:molybdopterin-guanine dinucleotide biosynthesis protein A
VHTDLLIDAIILAGGRSSRLGGSAKAELIFEKRTLVDRTLESVSFARTVVVVGELRTQRSSDRVIVTREDPPFSGPAAAIAAGIDVLESADPIRSMYTIVLACDMPGVDAAVQALLAALAENPADDGVAGDGFVAIDLRERQQPLAAIYKTERLTSAVARRRIEGTLPGLSMFALISGLTLASVLVPEGSTDDIDTWIDAEKFGIRRPDEGVR